MNKAKFKCILSVICLIFGLLLGFFSASNLPKPSTLFITTIILALSLILIGVVSCHIHYGQLKIIASLKNREVSILAHWFYLPKHLNILKDTIEQDRRTHLSIVILLGLFAFLLAMGFVLAAPTSGLMPSIMLYFFIGFFCIISYLIVCFYYHDKLNKNIEIIIGSDAIYFAGELYTLQRATCFLTDVTLWEGYEPHLQFLYSSPCVSGGPVHKVVIPVPPNQLEVAKHIRIHYLELIRP